MNDKPVNLGCVIAASLWAITVAVLLLSLHGRNVYLATMACALSVAAATATIRTYFVNSNRMMRNAFDLGRDAAGVDPASGTVTRMR